jgi:hypothetical protein
MGIYILNIIIPMMFLHKLLSFNKKYYLKLSLLKVLILFYLKYHVLHFYYLKVYVKHDHGCI